KILKNPSAAYSALSDGSRTGSTMNEVSFLDSTLTHPECATLISRTSNTSRTRAVRPATERPPDSSNKSRVPFGTQIAERLSVSLRMDNAFWHHTRHRW